MGTSKYGQRYVGLCLAGSQQDSVSVACQVTKASGAEAVWGDVHTIKSEYLYLVIDSGTIAVLVTSRPGNVLRGELNRGIERICKCTVGRSSTVKVQVETPYMKMQQDVW